MLEWGSSFKRSCKSGKKNVKFGRFLLFSIPCCVLEHCYCLLKPTNVWLLTDPAHCSMKTTASAEIEPAPQEFMRPMYFNYWSGHVRGAVSLMKCVVGPCQTDLACWNITSAWMIQWTSCCTRDCYAGFLKSDTCSGMLVTVMWSQTHPMRLEHISVAPRCINGLDLRQMQRKVGLLTFTFLWCPFNSLFIVKPMRGIV